MKNLLVFAFLFVFEICHTQFLFHSIPRYIFKNLNVNSKIWEITDKNLRVRDANTLLIEKTMVDFTFDFMVYDISNDDLGNIWCALGASGVGKFDGINWTYWNKSNTPELVGKSITDIAIMPDGRVLLKVSIANTIYELDVFENGKWQKFDGSPYIKDLNFVRFYRNGIKGMFLFTDKVISYYENGKWFSVPTDAIDNDLISDVKVGQDQKLYIQTYKRVYRYNSLNEQPIELLTGEAIFEFHILGNNEIIYNDSYKLYKFDGINKSVIDSISNNVRNYMLDDVVPLSNSDLILYYVNNSSIGIKKYQDHKLSKLQYSDFCFSDFLCLDNQNQIWNADSYGSISNNKGGNFTYPELFTHNKPWFQGIFQGPNSSILVVDSNILYQFENGHMSFLLDLKHNFVDLCINANQDIYILEDIGFNTEYYLEKINPVNGKMSSISINQATGKKPLGIESNPNSKTIWVLLEDVLYSIDENEQIVEYPIGTQLKSPFSFNVSLNNQILQVYSLDNGNGNVLYLFDVNLKKWSYIPIPNKIYNDVKGRIKNTITFVDKENTMHMINTPTNGEGLHWYRYNNMKWDTLKCQIPIPGIINGIQETEDGKLVVLGNGFILIYDKESTQIKIENKQSVSLAPNPSKNFINVLDEDFDILNYKIIDVNGRYFPVNEIIQNNKQLSLDISQLKPGQYFLIYQTKGRIKTKQFAKI